MGVSSELTSVIYQSESLSALDYFLILFGDENIYFIDGCDISQGNAQMLADDRHPNDYGMQEIAGAVIKCLEQAGW